MHSLVLSEASAVIHVGSVRYLHIPVVYPNMALSVPFCGRCERHRDDAEVGACIDINCGLSDRHHNSACAA